MSFHHPAQIPTRQPVATPETYTGTSTALAPPSFPSRPGSSILIDCRSEGLLTNNYIHRRTGEGTRGRCRGQLITFDMLPDDVLLEIFDLNVHEDVDEDTKQSIEVWIRLAHVCQRWRSIVFHSTLRLDLRLVCTFQTPTRDILDIWPPLRLIIRDFEINHDTAKPFIDDNILAALEHNDRVCQIQLIYPELGYFTNSAAILKPFPELTFLELSNLGGYPDADEPEPILPDLFSGGSAPRLRSLRLNELSFPGLPKLLLSATHLVDLYLYSIPRSGYVPPEVMAATLSALTNLESLRLDFRYPRPRTALETRRPPSPPPTRSNLPSLTKIEFKGDSEYLEVILARIDALQLDKLDITFFNQIILDTPQTFQFISRSPALSASEKGHITFSSWAFTVKFPSQTSDNDILLNVGIRCTASEWQLSSLEQICASSLPPVSTLQHLYISENRYDRPRWQDDVENTLWLDVLRSFVAVKNLYVSEEFAPRIAPALQELVGQRTSEVMPALENIYLQGFQPSIPLQRGIEKFVAARLLTSRPVAVSGWNMKKFG